MNQKNLFLFLLFIGVVFKSIECSTLKKYSLLMPNVSPNMVSKFLYFCEYIYIHTRLATLTVRFYSLE